MSKRTLCFDWSSLDGARKKKRKLSFEAEEDELFVCPVSNCLHAGYKSKRGLRKHINSLHEWFLFFDNQPKVSREEAQRRPVTKSKPSTHKQPAYSIETGFGLELVVWLQTPCGGGKSGRDAKQVARRGMKYLLFCVGDSADGVSAPEDYVDCCIGNATMLMKFLKLIMEDWRLKSAGAISYLQAISDLCDFRKWHGVTDSTLRLFAVTEVYLRRSKSTLYRKRNLEYSRDLSLESLIAQKSWATMKELEQVIPYHSEKYKDIFCRAGENDGETITISDLAFATRFIITFLLLRVKCTRPMSLQYLTVDMLESAKQNDGFVDQTKFKTSNQFQFDTLKFSKDALDVVSLYQERIRPLCVPKCDYVIINTSGTQYSSFCNAMSILTHEAIGKHITPTRYRAIVETESVDRLDKEKQAIISQDQKHSSAIARRCYQKKLSRQIAVEGAEAMKELVGDDREHHTELLANSLRDAELIQESTASNDASSNESERSGDADKEQASNVIELDDIPCTKNETIEANSNFHAERINVDEMPCSSATAQVMEDTPNLVVNDNIEVKKEEMEHGKKSFLLFDKTEDEYLRSGYAKHKKSRKKWSDILNDDAYKFKSGRNRDSLRMRASTLGLEKKTRNSKKKVT